VTSTPHRILFVCMGNICRSPTAEAVMRHLVTADGLADQFEIDSAGTGSWHAGQPPDARARSTAQAHGYELTGQARAVTASDFHHYDLIVSVDDENLARLTELAPPNASATLRKLAAEDVPDPYYGGDDGFAAVLAQIEAACRDLLAEVTAR